MSIQALRKEIAKLKSQLNAHRRFHGKSGCPGGDECYVCRIDENSAWPTEDVDKWELFPWLAQAMTEARLRAEASEAQLAFQGELLNSYRHAANTISGRARRLQAEVERLRKIGEAVVSILSDGHNEDIGCGFWGAKDVGCIACLAQEKLAEMRQNGISVA